MSRLIETDVLSKSIKDYFKKCIDQNKHEMNVIDINADIQGLLDNQPTAFDVDKVVEQFEKLKKIAEIMRNIDIEHNAYIEEAYERGRIYVLNEAVDIVKGRWKG